MDPAQIGSLPAMLSPVRFAPYLVACGADAAEAIRLYTWNVEVSAAFWGPLHAFEVVLRNALNDQLTVRYGRPDWWYDPGVQLNHVMAGQLRQAIADAAEGAKRKGRAVVPGDVVAAFTFAFWTGLTGSGGKEDGRHLQYETRYWQPALAKAFPHYPAGKGARGALSQSLTSIRLLRNRVAHHEPVFGRHLAADHDSLLRLAGYISPDATTYIASHSRVPAVIGNRQSAVTTGLTTSF